MRARAMVTTMRPERRVESEVSRWNPRLSSSPWMKGKETSNSHCGEEAGGLDMGSIRAGKLRAFQEGANPLYSRLKRREMGKGVERKRKVVFIGSGLQQSGRRDKRGWTTMAEMIRQMEELVGRRTDLQEVRAVGKATPVKSYVEAVMRTSQKGSNAIKMKVTREEIAGNLQKLEHCLIASWKPNKKEEEDLERMGSLWVNSWGLKGKLGLAKLERGRALLEFEDLSEAHRVVSSRSRVMGGTHLGLEFWNPKTGCWVEEEIEQEAWVKIFGPANFAMEPGDSEENREGMWGFC
ncbi:hypothetical protein CK203_009550 [Vitis vinifera]|uniref:DUF4283 domain-containing protein n=1 Tax=Vitis vinifera TaxID=29760 RepID=A0A438JSL3_VITVI|nr:hypothetical protein CK203_009550 [Vitis vinifera]